MSCVECENLDDTWHGKSVRAKLRYQSQSALSRNKSFPHIHMKKVNVERIAFQMDAVPRD